MTIPSTSPGGQIASFDPLTPIGAPQGPASLPNQVYAGLNDFVRVMRRRKWLILTTIMLVTGITFLVIARMTPVYSATATVMLKSLDTPPGTTDVPLAASPNQEARIATTVQLLSSRSLARRVARNMRLDEVREFSPPLDKPRPWFETVIGWFAPKQAQADRALAARSPTAIEKSRMESVTDNLMAQVEVKRVADSHLIDITALSIDPGRAAHIANRLAETNIRNQLNAERSSDAADIARLRASVESLRQQAQTADLAVALYRRDHGLIAERPQELVQAELTQAASALLDARAQRAASSGTSSVGPLSSTMVTSPLLNDLRSQETVLQKHLAELESFYGSGYPEVASVRAQLDTVRARVQAEAARTTVAQQYDLRSALAGAAAREAQVNSRFGAIRSEGQNSRFAQIKLQTLEHEAEGARALHAAMVARLIQTGASDNGNTADTSIVSKASPPDEASFPKPRRAIPVAFAGSAIFAVILALAADAFDDKLRTGDQVRRVLGLPTLAMVPRLPTTLKIGNAYEVIAEHPRSSFSESLRNLVIELEMRRSGSGSQVIVITSPLPDEGKSTIAVSLAAAAASIGRRAVTVDLDLRKITSGTDEDGAADLVAFLTKKAELDDLLPNEDHRPTFAKISVREQVLDPGGLLQSPRLTQLISALRERFDLIVLNAPPILPVRDAKTLSRLADGALLVLRWGKTDPLAARTALDVFGEGIIGCVINQVDYARHARRAYGDAIEHAQYRGGDYRPPEEDAPSIPLLTRLHLA